VVATPQDQLTKTILAGNGFERRQKQRYPAAPIDRPSPICWNWYFRAVKL